jgi:hypothetical protein
MSNERKNTQASTITNGNAGSMKLNLHISVHKQLIKKIVPVI